MRRLALACAAAVIAAAGACSAPGQTPAAPTLSPYQILLRAVQNMKASDAALGQYDWQERDIVRALGKGGKPAKVQSDETDEVSQVNGIQYDHMIARDGKPLNPRETAKAEAKAEKFIRDHSGRKAIARARREQAKAQQQQEQLLSAVPHAFELAFVSDPQPAGCDCYVITLTPAPHYHAPSKELNLLHHVSATVWIQRRDFGVVRVKVRFLRTVSVGWVLARLEPGSEVVMQDGRVDGHWFEQSLTGTLEARVMLVKHYHLQVDDSYSHYRKFEVTSGIAADKPVIRPRSH